MLYEEKQALSHARLAHAEECLAAADHLLVAGNYKSAANRSYYAVFHSMRAVLAYDEIDMKKHSGVIASFVACISKPAFSVVSCPVSFPLCLIYAQKVITMISL